jgi:type IV pilus assembly protein PilM
MIKNIFVPEKVGSYYIFQKKIVGFDVGKTHVTATLMTLKGKAATLEKTVSIPLDAGSTNNYDERAVKAIHDASQEIGAYDEVTTALSSSLVVFKELKLPFVDQQKIKMVLDFEIEPLLPFPVADAMIDFIVTKELPHEKSSEILVAAVQKQHIAHHLSLFEQAGISPATITVDLFALYGIYRLMPSYAHLPGTVAVIDLGAHATGIAFIDNGQLRLIRSLPRGTFTQAKTLSTVLDISPNDAMAAIVRFGLEKNNDPEYMKAVTTLFKEFWQDISLTLNSFSSQTDSKQMLGHIFILGGGAEIKGVAPFVSQLLGIECQLLQAHKLLQAESLQFTTKNGISPTTVISLAAALPTPTTAEFNLCKKEFLVTGDQKTFLTQLIVAATLVGLFFIALAQQDFFQARKLRNNAEEAKNEAITQLKSSFRKIPESENDLRVVVDMAEAELRKEEKLWFAFANPDRASFLRYLLELTSRINKHELGFEIDRLVMTPNSITMDAHVKDHAALSALERDLKQSKLLKNFEPVQSPDFKMKIRLP